MISFSFLVLVFALTVSVAAVITSGDGGTSTIFTGEGSDSQVRTPTIMLEKEGTLTYWVKNTLPASTPSLLSQGQFGIIWHFYDEENNSLLFEAHDYESIEIKYSSETFGSFPSNTDGWTHHAFTWKERSGEPTDEFKGYLNIADANSTSFIGNPILVSRNGHFEFGKGFYDSDVLFTGSVDEFCFWNRELTADELKLVHRQGCGSVSDTGKVFHYSFDDIRDIPPQLFNKANNEYDGLLRIDSLGVFPGIPDLAVSVGDPVSPVRSVDSAPISNTGIESHHFDITNGPQTFSLTVNGAISWKFLADDATVLTKGNLLVDGHSVSIGVSETVFELSFETLTVNEGDTFSFFYEATDGTDVITTEVLMTFNTVPECEDFNIELDEGATTVVYFPRHILVDGDGQRLIVQIMSLPSSALKVQSLASDASEIWDSTLPSESIPIDLINGRFALKHEGDLVSNILTDQLGFVVNDGMAQSSECHISISVNPVNQPPVPQAVNKNTSEDESVIVELLSSDKGDEPIITTITEFPSEGTLFQYPLASNIPVSNLSGIKAISQWAHSVEVSSFWPTQNVGGDTIIGPADVFPRHGDLDNAWQPSSDGDFTRQWVIVHLEKEIVVDTIDLYETWHSLATESIYVLNAENEWELAWTGEWNFEAQNPDATTTQAYIATYKICPKPFMTKSIKFNIRITDSHWYALDAVLVSGFVEHAHDVILDSNKRVVYVPNDDYFGSDSFKFTVNDCSNFQSSRNLLMDERTETVSLSISPINDAPRFGSFSESITDETKHFKIDIEATDVDSVGLVYESMNPPLYGLLEDNLHQLISVGQLSSPVLYYQPHEMNKGGKTVHERLSFLVRDSENLQDIVTIDITIMSENKPFEYTTLLTICFWLSILALFVQTMILFVWFYMRRAHVVIRLSSFRFSMIGLCFSFLTVFHGMAYFWDSVFLCRIRTILGIGVVFGYCGMLFFKSLRISKMVHNDKLKRIQLSDGILFSCFFLPVFGGVVIISIALSYFGTDFIQNETDSGFDEGYMLDICEVDGWSNGVLLVLYSVGFLAMLIVSWRVRNAPLELNEANHIVATTMVIILYFVFKFPMDFMHLDSPSISLLVNGIGFSTVILICNFIIYAPKLYYIVALEHSTIHTGIKPSTIPTEQAYCEGDHQSANTEQLYGQSSCRDDDDEKLDKLRQMRATSLIPNNPLIQMTRSKTSTKTASDNELKVRKMSASMHYPMVQPPSPSSLIRPHPFPSHAKSFSNHRNARVISCGERSVKIYPPEFQPKRPRHHSTTDIGMGVIFNREALIKPSGKTAHGSSESQRSGISSSTTTQSSFFPASGGDSSGTDTTSKLFFCHSCFFFVFLAVEL
eukprot:TRINITY_DN4101_c0_g1_i1.p1 TRINITY_DN4101_c0_g1~~TRINITY_DN4101_c0_g1_i1.p1  ORF type:complete len:1358 (-),score=309.98 TRINITY_DN4101_c0_g1_i1:63-4136(-)